MRIDCDGFEVETLINVRIARARLKVVEIPSYEASRVHGVSNLHAFRDGWRVLKTIVLERFAPVRLGDPGSQLTKTEQRAGRVEHRSGQDRRSGAERRGEPRASTDRRSGHGRRSTDQQPTTAISTQPLVERGMPA
jgi:hypothetical protein